MLCKTITSQKQSLGNVLHSSWSEIPQQNSNSDQTVPGTAVSVSDKDEPPVPTCCNHIQCGMHCKQYNRPTLIIRLLYHSTRTVLITQSFN